MIGQSGQKQAPPVDRDLVKRFDEETKRLTNPFDDLRLRTAEIKFNSFKANLIPKVGPSPA